MSDTTHHPDEELKQKLGALTKFCKDRHMQIETHKIQYRMELIGKLDAEESQMIDDILNSFNSSLSLAREEERKIYIDPSINLLLGEISYSLSYKGGGIQAGLPKISITISRDHAERILKLLSPLPETPRGV